MNVIFFGSTTDSVLVLEALNGCQLSAVSCQLRAVVTQPPRPVGRKQIHTPTPVETWSKAHGLTVLSFFSDPIKPWLYKDEQQVIDALGPLKADLLVSACFGQKIPWEAISKARFGGLNVHPSLLPRWRGADPVPWAILSGDHQTGVTVVTLSEKFDEGSVIAQKKIPITDTDTSDALRTKLFTIGAGLLIKSLDFVIASKAKQSRSRLPRPLRGLAMTPPTYARRLTREDGYEPWEAIHKAFDDAQEAIHIDRKFRAFHPWPGLWTLLRQGYGGQAKEMRLKILSLHLQPTTHNLQLELVQLEGKKPASWEQFRKAYLTS